MGRKTICGRNRFQALLTSLHFVNNQEVNDANKTDKLWKIRPILENYAEKPVPSYHKSGEIHQFGLGVGGDVVVQLCETLEKQKW